jgi:ADP-heptose:LPS heptosyltransferase
MIFLIKNLAKSILLSIERIFLTAVSQSQDGGVAVIRLDAIGDFILWLDSAKEYRRLYSNQKITLIADSSWADLAKQLTYWDEVWPINRRDLNLRQPLKRWRLLLRIRKGAFHTAIQPTFSRVSMYGDSVVRATGAKHCIGSVGDLTNASVAEQVWGNRWYTQLLPADPQPLMELLRNAEFFSHLASVKHSAALAQLPLLTSFRGRLNPKAPYFIVFPGASWVGRQWPVAQFSIVLSELQRCHGWQPVLCGSPSEFTFCHAIANTTSADCINLAGQTDLCELTEVIRGARLLIGNETSAVHIAAAVGTPAVCILGGGHYGRFMPYPDTVLGVKPVVAAEAMPCYHCNWQCNQPHTPNGPVPCISNISVATVLAAAQQALETAGLPQAGVELPFKNLKNLIEASTSIANSEP